MSIKSVDNASVSLQVRSEGADPGATIQVGRNRIVLHLTHHAEDLIASWIDRKPTDPDNIEDDISAINITGSVNVHLTSPHDDITPVGFSLSGWDFQFMQVVRVTTTATFAGRNASEGFVLVNFKGAPAYLFPMSWCLDAGRKTQNMPFYDPKPPGIGAAHKHTGNHQLTSDTLPPSVKTIITEMNDHPAATFPLKLSSEKTSPGRGRPFFMFRVVKVFEAVSVFVARNERKVIQPLASVGWSAIWNVRLRWSKGQPTVFMDKHQFNADKWVQGPVSDKDQASIINNPPTDVARTANAATEQANKFIVAHQSLPNVVFVERWSSDIPKDFYT